MNNIHCKPCFLALALLSAIIFPDITLSAHTEGKSRENVIVFRNTYGNGNRYRYPKYYGSYRNTVYYGYQGWPAYMYGRNNVYYAYPPNYAMHRSYYTDFVYPSYPYQGTYYYNDYPEYK